MLVVVVGLVLAGVTLLALLLVLAWFLVKKKGQRSQDVNEEFKGISSRASFRNAIHQSFVNQTQNTAAVIYTIDEYYGNGKVFIVNIVTPAASPTYYYKLVLFK